MTPSGAPPGDDVMQEFLDEAGEHLETIQHGLLGLEAGARRAADAGLLPRLFRAAHSLKGAAGMCGLDRTRDLTHALEEVLDALRADRVESSTAVVDALFAGADVLTALVAALAAGEGEAVETAAAAAALRGVLPAAAKSAALATTLDLSPDLRGRLSETDDLNLFVAEQSGRSVLEVRLDPRTLAARGFDAEEAARRLGDLAEVLATVPPTPAWPGLPAGAEGALIVALDAGDARGVEAVRALDLPGARVRLLAAAPAAPAAEAEAVEAASTPDRSKYLDLFLAESGEAVDGLVEALLTIEKDPAAGGVHQAFRHAHRLKGNAAAMGYDDLARLCHILEDLLDGVRDGTAEPTPERIGALLEAADAVRAYVVGLRTGADGGPAARAAAERLRALSGAGQAATNGAAASVAAAGRAAAGGGAPAAPPGGAGASAQTIRVDLAKLDGLMNLAGELVVTKARLLRLSETLREALDVKDLVWEVEDAAARAEEIPGGGEFADLLRSVGARARLVDSGRTAAADLVATALALSRISTSLQSGIMGARMLPVDTVFRRFPRLVRDLSRQFEKRIRLEISGEETELDKRVIDEIGDPLVHLVRNALDHGLEGPAERRRAGKPEEGCIALTAFREGSLVCIRLADDGRGIESERVLARARARGLVAAEARPARAEILRMIFLPGFSTAETVTDVSGRGVGMDIVKSRVEALGGAVDVESEAGRGTTVTLRIPLTLAVLQALLVRAGGAVLAVPVEQVDAIVKLRREEIRSVGGRPVAVVRGATLPVLRLAEVLGFAAAEGGEAAARSERSPALVVATRAGAAALLVDRVLGEEEVVVKALPDDIRGAESLSGATILGDGTVALILDAAVLSTLAAGRRAAAPADGREA